MSATAGIPITRFVKLHRQLIDHDSTDLATTLPGEVPWLESVGQNELGSVSNRDTDTDNRVHNNSGRPGAILRLDSATTQGPDQTRSVCWRKSLQMVRLHGRQAFGTVEASC
jgi:hypothetical protein